MEGVDAVLCNTFYLRNHLLLSRAKHQLIAAPVFALREIREVIIRQEHHSGSTKCGILPESVFRKGSFQFILTNGNNPGESTQVSVFHLHSG